MSGRMIKANTGFTLIELLVVIAILGILLVIAVPRIIGVREEALKREYEALNNRRYMGMEMVRLEYGHYLDIGYQVEGFTFINNWNQLQAVLECVDVILDDEPETLSNFEYDMNNDPHDFRIVIESSNSGFRWEITPDGPEEI